VCNTHEVVAQTVAVVVMFCARNEKFEVVVSVALVKKLDVTEAFILFLSPSLCVTCCDHLLKSYRCFRSRLGKAFCIVMYIVL
jgi:hypothetical protein